MEDHERQRDHDQGHLYGKTGREEPEHVLECIDPARRQERDGEEQCEQREHRQREPRRAPEQAAVREPRRDERAHLGRVGVLDAL